jgi:hypothetical protein
MVFLVSTICNLLKFHLTKEIHLKDPEKLGSWGGKNGNGGGGGAQWSKLVQNVQHNLAFPTGI